MASIAITTPSVIINNVTIAILPNSLNYTEGFGEQSMRTQSAGGGSVDVVYSDNAESKMSSVNFDMINTAENIALARSWKANLNQNAISVVAPGFSRNFSNMALVSDYSVELSADGKISLEFMGNAAV
jgi:hypothetical protein